MGMNPLTPKLPGAEDIHIMQSRVAWLNFLYDLDGRKSTDHPEHGLFTGLHQKYAGVLLDQGADG